MALPLASRRLVLGRLVPFILPPLLAAASFGPLPGASIESLGLLEGGESTDSNRDGMRDVSDAIYTLTFLFAGGQPPDPPFPDCDDLTGCEDRCL